MLRTLSSRFPSRSELLPVYSILAFLVFSWALYRMAWYAPSWLEYLSLGSILVIAAYALGFALVESALMLGLLALLAALLPAPLLRARFVAQGGALALALGAGAVLLQRQVRIIYRWEVWQVFAYAAAAVGAVLLILVIFAWVFHRFPRLLQVMNRFAERMTIFTYVYAPLGIAGLVVVILRNLM